MINKINDFSYKSFFHYTNLDKLLITKNHITFVYNGRGRLQH